MTSVRVECRIGQDTYARCVADVFAGNVLTITALDNGSVQHEYQPGTWRTATVYDEHGNVEYCHRSALPVWPMLSEQQARKGAA